MGKHYSEELKNEIIQRYLNKEASLERLGKDYGISPKSIFNWLRKYRANGTVENDIFRTRGGQKSENINYKERYEILKKYLAFIKAQREKK